MSALRASSIPAPTLITVALLSAVTQAADVPKANNTLSLNDPASWVNNSLPQSTDNALWNNIVASPNSVLLGDNLTWSLIKVADPAGDVTINADGHTLTLYSGIDMSAATRNLTLNNILHFQNISSPSYQVLNVGAGVTLALNGPILLSAPGFSKVGPGLMLLGNGGIHMPVPGPYDLSSYTFETDDGTTRLTSSDALDSTRVQLFVGNQAIFDLNGNNATAGAILSAGMPNNSTITNSSPTPSTLTLRGPFLNSINSNWQGVIADGSGTVALTLNGGVHLFSGHNTFTGPLTLHHDQLINSFNEAAGVISNIFNPAAPLVLEGGEFNMRGTVTSATPTQTFASTALNPGQSSIVQEINASLSLNAITRHAGATLYVGSKGPGVFTTNTLTPSGILGGWAANAEFNVDVNNWLTRDTSSPSSALVPLPQSDYSSSFTVTSNTDVVATLIAAPNVITGSVRFNSPSSTLVLSGATKIDSGGILITSNASTSSITTVSLTDSITAASSPDLIIHQYANTPFSLDAIVANNGATPIALTKAGSGTLILTKQNSYAGGTFLNNGTLLVGPAASLGTGPIILSRYPYASSNTQLILSDGINLPNNILADFNTGSSASPPFVNVPAGNATLAGSITVHQNDQFLLGTLASSGAGGTLTLIGASTSGDPGSNMQVNTTELRGNVIFAGNSSLTSYQTPIRILTFGGPGIGSMLTLRDSASLSVLNVQPPSPFGQSSGIGFDTGTQSLSNGFTFTIQDSAQLNIGPLDFDLNNINNSNSISSTVFHLDGGTIMLGRFVMTDNFPTETATLLFNGTTLLAGKSTASFLDNKLPAGTRTLFASVSTGGARINTNSFAVTVNADFLHDPSLGAASDGGLTKLGAGTLSLTGTAHSFTGPLSIQQGTVALNAPVALKVSALTIAQTGGSYKGTLDLANSPFVVQSASPAEKSGNIISLDAALAAGGSGTGITSSTAATNSSHFAVSLYDNADLQLATFGSQPVDDNSLLLTLAPRGDANFDGKVNSLDLNVLASHWQQQSGATDSSGDFTHDGKVNSSDLNVLAANWEFGTGAASTAQSFNVALAAFPQLAAVPEPVSLALLLPGALVLWRRRRTR